jgi:hypothetical protein
VSNYAALADKIDQARTNHLNSFGGSPRVTSRKRADLEILLREEVATIIAALRLASQTDTGSVT